MRWLAALAVFFSSVGLSETMEDRLAMPTDARSIHPFNHNPAIIDMNHFGLSAAYDSTTKKTKAIGSPNSGNETEFTFDRPVKTQALALQIPLGGAAILFGGQFIGSDLSARMASRDRGITEYYRERRYEGRFALELLPKTAFAFSYRYHQLESDIFGSFNLNSGDRTSYKGTMSGYAAGLFHRDGKLGLGIFYIPPMRGKSEIVGEQKLISYPGLSGLDGVYEVKNGFNLGVFYKKWFYKADDRTELSTSPDDDRTILLGGVDIDQFWYRTAATGIGADVEVIKDVELRLGIIRQDGVFLFADNAIPGDKKSEEKALQYLYYKAGIRFKKDKIAAEFVLTKSDRVTSEISDRRGVFGHGRYGDYSSKEQGAYVALSFQP